MLSSWRGPRRRPVCVWVCGEWEGRKGLALVSEGVERERERREGCVRVGLLKNPGSLRLLVFVFCLPFFICILPFGGGFSYEAFLEVSTGSELTLRLLVYVPLFFC